MTPVVCSAAGPQRCKAGLDCIREPEEVECEVDKMRAEIEPEASSRTGLLAPALADKRAETVHVCLEVHNFAQDTGGNDGLCSEDIALPPAILEDGKEPVMLACNTDEFARFREIKSKRLVDDYVLADA
jgi:hypothetical protein